MAIKTQIIVDFDTTTLGAAQLFFYLKEFLVRLGWTVAGSGDGTTGAMDGVDRIVDIAAMSNQWSWVVVTSPHLAAGDRVQWMFNKANDVTHTVGKVDYAPNTSFTGGGAAAFPTATNQATLVVNHVIGGGYTMMLHFLGDTAAPYGWAVYGHQSGDPEADETGIAFIPLEQLPASAGKPYVAFAAANPDSFQYTQLDNSGLGTGSSHGVAEPHNPPQTPGDAPALLGVYNAATIIVPSSVVVAADQQDQAFPTLFTVGGSPGQYAGVSTFMRWSGKSRRTLSTFDRKSRIVFKDVSFPWDGRTIPIP